MKLFVEREDWHYLGGDCGRIELQLLTQFGWTWNDGHAG